MKILTTRITLLYISLAIFALLFANLSYAKIDPKTVVGLWLFNEGDGDEAEDISGNKNNGTLMVNPKWVKGKFGGALELNGTNYVSVAHSDSLTMEDQVTVAFWFYTDKKMVDMWADRQVIVGKHFLEYEVGVYPQGQIHTYTNDGTGANPDEGVMASMAGKLPGKEAEWELGKWYHIAWTLNKAHEIAYVDGVKIGETNKAHENTKALLNPLEIGRRVGGSLYLIGGVDEVGVFNVALDEEDIQNIFKNGFEFALGITAVAPGGKLAASWASIKNQ